MTSIDITSKEIIQRIVAHDASPRIGFDFGDRSDLCFVGSRRHVNVPENPFDNWGQYSELEALTGFHGETGLFTATFTVGSAAKPRVSASAAPSRTGRITCSPCPSSIQATAIP